MLRSSWSALPAQFFYEINGVKKDGGQKLRMPQTYRDNCHAACKEQWDAQYAPSLIVQQKNFFACENYEGFCTFFLFL